MKIVVTKDMRMHDSHKKRLEALGEVTYYDTESASPEEWHERVKDADVICTGRLGLDGKAVFTLQDKLISLPFVGYDFLDVDKLKERNITVTNAPGCNKEAVAEWVVGILLMRLRNLHQLSDPQTVSKDLALLTGGSIWGKNITILGNGNIGQHLQRIFETMGATVTVFKRDDDLIESAAQANIVVNCLPVNEDTRGMVDQAFFASLQLGVFFVSISRHHTYDIDALITGLDERRIAGAMDDVANAAVGDPTDEIYQKLAAHPKVLATPHIAWNAESEAKKANDIMIDNIEAWVQGELQNVVN